MSEAEVEALKARLAGLGVRLSATTTPSPARSVSSPGGHSARRSPTYQPARPADVEYTSTATTAAAKPWNRGPASSGSPTPKMPKRTPGYEYDSDRSVDVSELLERCSRVETILSKAESAARKAEDVQGYERRAMRLGYESESAAKPRKAGRKKAVKAAKSSPSRRRQASSPPAPPFIPAARRGSAQVVDTPQTPLASVLAQYREAESVWAQERAKMRRELVEQRKRANRFESDYKKLVNQFDARAVDIKSMKAALKNRDTQLHQLTLKLREAEESLQRCNETAAEELAALTGGMT